MTSRTLSWALAIGGVATVTAVGRAMQLNPNTVGFLYLVAVLLTSLRGGLAVGMSTSVLATLCYNFFFFPPLHTFAIHDASNWVALATFLITSVVVSRLVLAARIQADREAHLQALRASESLKTSLLRAISHDLNTPLTAIAIETEGLQRKAEADADVAAAVHGIATATATLRRRIENLLSMARLEAGKTKPRREPTPPADLFRAVRENLPLVFRSRPVSVVVDDDCPDVNVDPSLALEILVNLIENADRVSPEHAPIELTARPLEEGHVRIEILDRGPGVPRAVATSDLAQRGLGLEIARSLAAANGGTVALTPRPGGGTVARLDLPSAPLPQELPA